MFDLKIGTHMFSTNQTLFVSERGSSYRCNTKTDVTGFQVTRNINVTSVSLENLLVEPFADDSMEFTDYSVGMLLIEIKFSFIFYLILF